MLDVVESSATNLARCCYDGQSRARWRIKFYHAFALQTLPAGDELIQAVLSGNVSATPEGRINLPRAGQALIGMSRIFQVRIPCMHLTLGPLACMD